MLQDVEKRYELTWGIRSAKGIISVPSRAQFVGSECERDIKL